MVGGVFGAAEVLGVLWLWKGVGREWRVGVGLCSVFSTLHKPRPNEPARVWSKWQRGREHGCDEVDKEPGSRP